MTKIMKILSAKLQKEKKNFTKFYSVLDRKKHEPNKLSSLLRWLLSR